MTTLNARAWRLCEQLPGLAPLLRIQPITTACGATIWDFGNKAPGGLIAGQWLARVCLADLAQVELVPDVPAADSSASATGMLVHVYTDHPLHACMHSQYAGWKLSQDAFFAMGSGPMRAAAANEAIFQGVGREPADCAVGVLETSDVPPDDLVRKVAEKCQVAPERLCLLLARTASQAGSLQVVARSVETALHKLMELQFDLNRVVSASGTAPLPPVARKDLEGIGRTNDAVLYGGSVTLWVRGDDASIEAVVGKVPSCSSSDFGQPFGQIFARYEYDFYRIDPHLFSPAEVRIINLDTGHTFHAGQVRRDILATSWGA
jgi:methenyltetrahydromethanopterin cyclohydrolase